MEGEASEDSSSDDDQSASESAADIDARGTSVANDTPLMGHLGSHAIGPSVSNSLSSTHDVQSSVTGALEETKDRKDNQNVEPEVLNRNSKPMEVFDVPVEDANSSAELSKQDVERTNDGSISNGQRPRDSTFDAAASATSKPSRRSVHLGSFI